MMNKIIIAIYTAALSLCCLSAHSATTVQKGMRIVFTPEEDDQIILVYGKPMTGKVKKVTVGTNPLKYYTLDLDKNGNLLAQNTYQDGKLVLYHRYKYDSQGRAIKKEYMDNGYKNNATYEYDEYGNPLKRIYKEDGNKEVVLFTYDYDKREIKAKEADKDFPYRLFKFDENGRVWFRQTAMSERSTTTHEYTYNEKGQLVELKTSIDRDGHFSHLVETKVETYTYNEQGYWSEVTQKVYSVNESKNKKDGEETKPVVKASTVKYTDYQYDAKGNVTSCVVPYGKSSYTDKRTYTYYE